MIVSDKTERKMWKKVAVAYFKVASHHLTGETEENAEN
jgi:hypothetical protein